MRLSWRWNESRTTASLTGVVTVDTRRCNLPTSTTRTALASAFASWWRGWNTWRWRSLLRSTGHFTSVMTSDTKLSDRGSSALCTALISAFANSWRWRDPQCWRCVLRSWCRRLFRLHSTGHFASIMASHAELSDPRPSALIRAPRSTVANFTSRWDPQCRWWSSLLWLHSTCHPTRIMTSDTRCSYTLSSTLSLAPGRTTTNTWRLGYPKNRSWCWSCLWSW